MDFSKNPPQIIDKMKHFAYAGLVSEQFAEMYSFDELNINSFFNHLYKLMMERYYLIIKD